MKYLLFSSLLIVALCFDKTYKSEQNGYIPKAGFVPNSETAIKIAEAVWFPIYGNDIYDKKPFVAKLVDSTIPCASFYTIRETLHQQIKSLPFFRHYSKICF